MKQLSIAGTEFLPKVGKQFRKAVFLAEMDTVVPWPCLEALIGPFYPKKGNGRPPMPFSTMLRSHWARPASDAGNTGGATPEFHARRSKIALFYLFYDGPRNIRGTTENRLMANLWFESASLAHVSLLHLDL